MATALIAIGCTCLAPARADVLTLVMPATLASPDAMDDPGIAFGALPDLELASRNAQDTFETAFNAALIDNILTTTGSLAGLEPRVKAIRPGDLRPADLREAFTTRIKVALPTSPTVAQIANPTFGSPDGVAVSIAQKLVPTGEAAAGLNTDIRVRHASDLVDAGFNLAGRRNFIVPDPMAVSYDGHALVSVNQAVQLGVAARGNLGTVNAFALGSTQTAGPLLHFNLGQNNVSLSSDLGYDFGLNQMSAMTRAQLHVKMGLKIKL